MAGVEGAAAGFDRAAAFAAGARLASPFFAGAVGFAPAAPIRTGITRDYYWNNNAYRVIQPKTARTNVHAAAELDLNDRVTAFADFTLYRAHSVTYREPDGVTQSTDGFIIVPVTNPWNPFGNRFWSPTGAPNADGTARLTGTPSAVSITNKRMTDLATRTDYVDTALYRGVAGLRGKLLSTWSWEAAVLWAQGRVTENEEGPTRKSLLIQAINQTEPGRAFNPFTRTFAVQNGQLVVTGPYVNPESVQSTFRSSFIRSGITKLGSADFRASGDLVQLWGGNAVGAAFGGEFRYEAYDDFRPPFAGLNPPGSGLDPLANDFLGFSPNSDTHGNRHVAALYAEAVVPLVGRNFQLPLVRSLELSASARYESYTDFGETTKPKLGVNWRPFDWAMVRASYNEGFHAPNLAQLFTGTLIRTVTGSTDTYRSTVTGLITDGPSNRRSVASGNRDLQPEVARGKSAGVVIEVPGVRGLSVSVDYWEIRQRDVIASGGGIADDTAALLAATQSALAAGQTLGQIDLGSGTGAYKGDPSVVRLPVTQADRDAFAALDYLPHQRRLRAQRLDLGEGVVALPLCTLGRVPRGVALQQLVLHRGVDLDTDEGVAPDEAPDPREVFAGVGARLRPHRRDHRLGRRTRARQRRRRHEGVMHGEQRGELRAEHGELAVERDHGAGKAGEFAQALHLGAQLFDEGRAHFAPLSRESRTHRFPRW